MARFRVAWAGFAVLAVLSLPVLASERTWVQAYTSISGDDLGTIVNWLQWQGYITRYERFTDSTGDPAFRITTEDCKFTILMYGRSYDSHGDAVYTSLQTYAGFDLVSTGLSCTTINRWNREYRQSRAYLDSEGDPFLEADLSLRGGVAEDAIKMWLILYLTSVETFIEYIEW